MALPHRPSGLATGPPMPYMKWRDMKRRDTKRRGVKPHREDVIVRRLSGDGRCTPGQIQAPLLIRDEITCLTEVEVIGTLTTPRPPSDQ
jgi:hypothetical protein